MLINKAHIYKLMVEHLRRKCQELQMCNEQCVQRITKIKKIKRRRKRDVGVLKARLDKYKDNWRAVSMKRQLAPHPKRKTEQKRGPKPKAKQTTLNQEQTIQSPNSITQSPQVQQQHLQYHQFSGQLLEPDWSGLNEPEPFQLE